jgi:hypothetical protein
MRPARTTVLVLGAILAFVIRAGAVSATSTPHEAHLTKDCSTYDGQIPSLCTISASDLPQIAVGTKVWYLGPVLTNSYFLSSNVSLEAESGSKSTGYCIFEAKESVGLCTFWAGTGSLSGFTGVFNVTIDTQGLWHLDGIYYFSDQPVSAVPGGRAETASAWS